MKKTFLLAGILLINLNLFAQQTQKLNELGLTTRSLNTFGITYRFGNEKSVWRINVFSTNGQSSFDNSNNRELKENRYGAALQLGKERRTAISNTFELRHGLDFGFSYNSSKIVIHDNVGNLVTDRLSRSYEPKINLVLGFNFIFNQSFLLGAALQPSISYQISNNKNYDENSKTYNSQNRNYFNFGLSNQVIQLSLAYRFNKSDKKEG